MALVPINEPILAPSSNGHLVAVSGASVEVRAATGTVLGAGALVPVWTTPAGTTRAEPLTSKNGRIDAYIEAQPVDLVIGAVAGVSLGSTRRVVLGSEPSHEVGAVGEPAFQNAWVNYGGSYERAGFYMDPGGTVHLNGLVTNGTAGAIFTLPVGYRPALTGSFPSVAGDAFAEVRVYGAGTVNRVVGSGWVSLAGISFRGVQ